MGQFYVDNLKDSRSIPYADILKHHKIMQG